MEALGVGAEVNTVDRRRVEITDRQEQVFGAGCVDCAFGLAGIVRDSAGRTLNPPAPFSPCAGRKGSTPPSIEYD